MAWWSGQTLCHSQCRLSSSMFHCQASATSTRQKERKRARMMGQTLTVPLEPSFVPFGFFCMTAVADLESLMTAG
jgi:hypothetical protein